MDCSTYTFVIGPPGNTADATKAAAYQTDGPYLYLFARA
jgi:hypothetical protein